MREKLNIPIDRSENYRNLIKNAIKVGDTKQELYTADFNVHAAENEKLNYINKAITVNPDELDKYDEKIKTLANEKIDKQQNYRNATEYDDEYRKQSSLHFYNTEENLYLDIAYGGIDILEEKVKELRREQMEEIQNKGYVPESKLRKNITNLSAILFNYKNDNAIKEGTVLPQKLFL